MCPSQGEVYVKIIKDTIDLSRTDFEEGGVDASTLEVLQSVSSHEFLLLSTQIQTSTPCNSKECE